MRRHSKQSKRPGGSGQGAASTHTTVLTRDPAPNNRDAAEVNRNHGRHAAGAGGADDRKGGGDANVDKRVAIYIAILAVLLTVCTMGGDNAAKDATRTNILASDTWAHFQAKKLRELENRLAGEALELKLASEPGMTEEARKLVEEKLRKYRAEAERLKSDPKEGDGQAELMVKARTYEAEREEALRRDPYFDYGAAFLQIAIVLSSASILFGGGVLLAVSAVVGGAGVIFMINGFTMLFNLPFLG